MGKYSYLLAYMILMALPSFVLLYFIGPVLNPKALLIEIFVSLLVGGVFCIWAEKQGKKDKFYIWKYNSKAVLNKKLLGVEIEDFLLFLILTPVFAVAMWEMAKLIVKSYEISYISMIGVGGVVLAISYFIAYKISKK
jgi:hypothetical protein